jgi:peptidoglycan/LPS O-acetylase OafA/YrhL
MPLSARPDEFRPDIEGLRAIAILLVVACHCGVPRFAGGFVGVDVFFVLSGYLITRILFRELRETSRIDLTAFFARRVRRLLPTSALVLLTTALVASAIYTPQELSMTARAVRAASLYVSNIYFDGSAADYFAPAVIGNPLLHTWSLGVEEQFYLLWPCLILLARGRARSVRQTLWILSTVAALSLSWCIAATRLAPTFAFYELPARAWEFAAGGILALLPAKASGGNSPIAAGGAALGLSLIVGSGVLIRGGADFPGWLALSPVVGTLLVLYAGAIAPGRGFSAALGTAPLRFIGARSYGWYLWHWPFLLSAETLMPGLGLPEKAGIAIASLAVAAITFRLIEQPVRDSSYLRTRPVLSLSAAAAVTFCIVASSWAVSALARHRAGVDQAYERISAASIDFGDLPRDCWSDGNAFDARVCEFGPSDASRSMALFGDSHAMQWFNAMRTVAADEGWRLLTFLRPRCAARDVNPPGASVGVENCRQWRARAIEKIIAAHPSVIVMASYSAPTMDDKLIPATEVTPATWRTLESLSPAGVPIVILRDSPLPPFHVPICLAKHYPDSNGCDFAAATALNAEVYAGERAAAEGMANVRFIDMDDLICPDTVCPTILHGLVIYRDQDHMTGAFARSLAPELRLRLKSVLAELKLTPPATDAAQH